MLVIYLSQNTSRNKRLLDYCDDYGIAYTCQSVELLTGEELLSLFAKSPDCFELLTLPFKRLSCQNQMKLSELVALVLQNPQQHLRLPMVVAKEKVYPDIRLDEIGTFLPRGHKELRFRHYMLKGLREEVSR